MLSHGIDLPSQACDRLVSVYTMACRALNEYGGQSLLRATAFSSHSQRGLRVLPSLFHHVFLSTSHFKLTHPEAPGCLREIVYSQRSTVIGFTAFGPARRHLAGHFASSRPRLRAAGRHVIFTAAGEQQNSMDFRVKAQIMDAAGMSRAISRLASQIVERNVGVGDLLLVGIRRRGVPLAERIADRIKQLEDQRPPTGQLDITLYRDDLSTIGPRPVVNRTDIPDKITDRTIVLVDDVLYTGRTVRAALDELVDFGRPRRVELAVLIDRGHRELPIQADYVGKYVQTTDSEIIKVMLSEYDEEEQVVLVEQE